MKEKFARVASPAPCAARFLPNSINLSRVRSVGLERPDRALHINCALVGVTPPDEGVRDVLAFPPDLTAPAPRFQLRKGQHRACVPLRFRVRYVCTAKSKNPLRTWTVERVTLLGDACHPTLPFLAQGANMALEDALVLARCLEKYENPLIALQRYEAARD
jgi:2-polyprenyl-6-methoxyphenol hydroxylase-like FAD-dependent oxidoreductase